MQSPARLISAIASALELPTEYRLSGATLIKDVPGWDSVAWISVIAALEEATQKEFPVDAVDSVRTVDDLIRLTLTAKPDPNA
jgi:acyl carrier protein